MQRLIKNINVMAFCINCGSSLADDVKFCSNCGAVVKKADADNQQTVGQAQYVGNVNNVSQERPPMPDSNLVWAILTTILCFLPFGIVSIVYSSKVSTYYFTGQYELAKDASKKAGLWAMWSAISMGIIIVIIVIIAIIAANAARHSFYSF